MIAPSAPSIGTTLRRLTVAVYAPTFLVAFGLGMLVPVLPLYLEDRGLSLTETSLVLAGVGIGAAVGGFPGGSLIARHGERAGMLLGFVALAVTTAPLGLTDAVWLLLLLRVVVGAANSVVRLSRQTFVTRRVVVEQRGRALALVGGSYRTAFAFAPVLGGLLVDLVGFGATFLVAGASAALGLWPAWFSERRVPDLLPEAAGAGEQAGVIESLRRHWRRLAVVGWLPFLLAAVREGRFVVLPLIGAALGLTPTEIGAIVTVGTFADMALFPVAGWLMDRFGRLSAWVPAFGLLTVGLVLLGFSTRAWHVTLAGLVIGIGNGLSAGAVLTLGSDLAPVDAAGPFLAGVGVISSGGRIVGALMIGVVGDWLDLADSALALAALMVAATAWTLSVIGEPSDPARIRSASLR